VSETTKSLRRHYTGDLR